MTYKKIYWAENFFVSYFGIIRKDLRRYSIS